MSNEVDIERALIEAVDKKDLELVRDIIRANPDLNVDCVDKDDLTPLQHSCHNGQELIARLLIDNGADVNYTKRSDGYTALMFAAISNKQDMVRLLLERGVDTTVENCVKRTATQMAAFVGLFKVVQIINSWVPYEKSIEPYTRPRELEDKPRIPDKKLGRVLHEFVVLPSLHPVKFFQFIKSRPHLIKHGKEIIYVLENLCSKTSKPPHMDEIQSLKYHYLAYLIQYCLDHCNPAELELKRADGVDFDESACLKLVDAVIRRLIKRANPDEIQPTTSQLNHLIVNCAMKFPYAHLGIFKTMTFAMNKSSDPYQVFSQSLNGPTSFGRAAEACSICAEVNQCKKCSKCKAIYYCGQPCQVADWFQHKKVCKSPEEKPLLGDMDSEVADE